LIPFRDDIPTRSFPVLVVGIIAANVAVFAHIAAMPHQEQQQVFYSLAAIPAELLSGRGIGASTIRPVWLTLFTSMFMHGSWMHLLGNMLYLWIFGNNIEELLGRPKFLLFYLAGGVAAMMTHVAFNPHSQVPAVGASGAISGVLGAYAVKYPSARVYTLLLLWPFLRVAVLPAWLLLGFWFALQLVGGMGSLGAASGAGIAWFAHVGGFIAGMVLVALLGGRERREARRREWETDSWH
jgi:membrane associated rhomboid family serine protease